MANEKGILCKFLTINKCFSQTSNDTRDLFNTLFVNNDYNKQVRPVFDQTGVVLVTVPMQLTSIYEIDEVSEKLVVSGFLYIYWVDESVPAVRKFGNNSKYHYL